MNVELLDKKAALFIASYGVFLATVVAAPILTLAGYSDTVVCAELIIGLSVSALILIVGRVLR